MVTTQEAFDKLIELQHMMGALHHRNMAEHGPMGDPTRGRGRVLALLKMRDGLSTRDMANVLGIRVSSLNETLSRLEAQGYVLRRPSEEDRRVMLVFLTERGKAEGPTQDLAEQIFDGFDDEELAGFCASLDRMQQSLERQLGPDWRERMERGRNRRKQIFHQAADEGPIRGHHHGHEAREHDFGGGRPGERGFTVNARYAPDADRCNESHTCNHHCRTCTRSVCVHAS